MSDKRSSSGAIIGGLVALALLLLVAYVAAYYLRCDSSTIVRGSGVATQRFDIIDIR